ncbi:MAG: anthranilate synthase component I [Bacteroidota bacterium]
MMTFEEFRSLSTRGNVIPVHETVLADTETAVSLYLKLRSESPYSFLLESVEGAERVARYTFLGFDPFMLVSIHDRSYRIEVLHDDVTVLPSLVDGIGEPLAALKLLFSHFKTVPVPGLPRFSGGAVGYFGYESVRLVEEVGVVEKDELGIPDALLMFCDTLVIIDNVTHGMSLVSNGYIRDGAGESDLAKEYEKAVRGIDRLKALLKKSIVPEIADARGAGPLEALVSREDFTANVRTCKDYIVAGDVFQVVLSQRMKRRVEVDPFSVYRTLRVLNPSPYMYHLALGSFQVVGASPELLVRVEGRKVETRPIAGTRRRGKHPEEDRLLALELAADEKERAEHLMLVDLGRNDVGRISEFGSVRVTESMKIEKYSHVMHLVSAIQGTLRKDVSPIDALFACFPAGTLTGAPKIRAMEIIAELEPVKRGIYGGAIGYIDFSGNLDSCIAIRTIVVKDGVLYFQAGAGIVHDSVPEREYEETMEKLHATLRAYDQVAEGKRG